MKTRVHTSTSNSFKSVKLEIFGDIWYGMHKLLTLVWCEKAYSAFARPFEIFCNSELVEEETKYPKGVPHP